MNDMNRREFVERAAAAAGGVALAGVAPQERRVRRWPTTVRLGRTGIRTSLLGIGTGTRGWNKQSNQTRLGQQQFTALVRHALDNGVRLFDCADMYGSHSYLREALKGVPRHRYVLLTKTAHRQADEVRADIDRFRQELGVDMIDIVLMHVVTEPDWNVRYRGVMEVLEEARSRRTIRAHGCSCHSFQALEAAAADPWVQVNLARLNPWGRMMDEKPGEPAARAPELVRPVLERMRAAGKGVLGMKILAEGRAVRGEDRGERIRESVRFAVSTGTMDAMVIGFESIQQFDEVLRELRAAVADVGLRVA
ncbi:MAG TPA: aldo/keto reductase [Chthonomonadales bacterium]|nr:aldo/keto reductase [Chthonomonadales bacterium]